MDRGGYSAASSGLAQLRKLEVVNNNLANINTPGFKRQFIITETQSFDDTLAKEFESTDPFARPDHERTPGAVNIATAIDFSQGAIKNTGNPLDVALRNPNDFLVVQTADGRQFTRAGNLSLDAEGQIVTADGAPVVGDGGPIIAQGAGLVIAADGAVRVDNAEVGRLQVVRFEDPSKLEPVGNSRFKIGAGVPQPVTVDGELEPGALEMSNVSPIASVVELISTTRGFDLYTRTARTIDEMNQVAITQVGRRL